MYRNLAPHFAEMAKLMNEAATLVRIIQSPLGLEDHDLTNHYLTNLERDFKKNAELLREHLPPAPRVALTDAQMEDLYQRLGGKPLVPTVNEGKVKRAI